MSGEQPTGQTAPIEAVNLVPEQVNAGTPPEGAEPAGADETTQNEPRTYSEEEYRQALDKATAKAAAKAERKARREALEEFQALTQKPQAQEQPRDDERPARKQGEADDDYLDRLTDWKLEQRDRKESLTRQQQQQKEALGKTEKLYAEAEKLEGFDRDSFDELPLTQPMVKLLMESDVAPALMKHMADNPDEVKRIAKLSPERQAAEVGKLEAILADAPKKVSSAPEPITPIRKPSGRPPITDTTDPRSAKELSTAEWIKAEEARMRKKYGGG